MAKVIEFPIKNVSLPEEVEDCLYEIGKAYIKVLNYALTECSSDNPTQTELAALQEKVLESYSNGLIQAVIEYEKGLYE